MNALDDLLQLLDELIGLLGGRVHHLRSMGERVRCVDAAGMAQVLQADADLQEQSAAAEQQLRRGLCSIAEELGLPPEEARVGCIAECLTGPDSLALDDRRERLALAVQQLQEESVATAGLVRYALEFNAKLLSAIAGADSPGQTYSAHGSVEAGCAGTTVRHTV